MRIILVVGLLLVAVIASACLGGSEGPGVPTEKEPEVGILKGDIAKDFTVYDRDGNAVQLSDFRGQYVFLNFWSSWCPPCRVEMPMMEEIYQERRGELAMLAVSSPFSFGDETEEKAIAFFDENGFSYTLLYDRDGRIEKSYRIFNIPVTYLIRPDGVIAAALTGPRNWSSDDCRQLLELFFAGEDFDITPIEDCGEV